jgi:hypothetical protein
MKHDNVNGESREDRRSKRMAAQQGCAAIT